MQGFFENMGGNNALLLFYGLMIFAMYFFLFRPQSKRKKQEEEMKKSIKIGDEIITIGGIMGKVVSIKEDSDSMVIETGSEKIRIKRWAIGTISQDNSK